MEYSFYRNSHCSSWTISINVSKHRTGWLIGCIPTTYIISSLEDGWRSLFPLLAVIEVTVNMFMYLFFYNLAMILIYPFLKILLWVYTLETFLSLDHCLSFLQVIPSLQQLLLRLHHGTIFLTNPENICTSHFVLVYSFLISMVFTQPVSFVLIQDNYAFGISAVMSLLEFS